MLGRGGPVGRPELHGLYTFIITTIIVIVNIIIIIIRILLLLLFILYYIYYAGEGPGAIGLSLHRSDIMSYYLFSLSLSIYIYIV